MATRKKKTVEEPRMFGVHLTCCDYEEFDITLESSFDHIVKGVDNLKTLLEDLADLDGELVICEIKQTPIRVRRPVVIEGLEDL